MQKCKKCGSTLLRRKYYNGKWHLVCLFCGNVVKESEDK